MTKYTDMSQIQSFKAMIEFDVAETQALLGKAENDDVKGILLRKLRALKETKVKIDMLQQSEFNTEFEEMLPNLNLNPDMLLGKEEQIAAIFTKAAAKGIAIPGVATQLSIGPSADSGVAATGSATQAKIDFPIEGEGDKVQVAQVIDSNDLVEQINQALRDKNPISAVGKAVELMKKDPKYANEGIFMMVYKGLPEIAKADGLNTLNKFIADHVYGPAIGRRNPVQAFLELKNLLPGSTDEDYVLLIRNKISKNIESLEPKAKEAKLEHIFGNLDTIAHDKSMESMVKAIYGKDVEPLEIIQEIFDNLDMRTQKRIVPATEKAAIALPAAEYVDKTPTNETDPVEEPEGDIGENINETIKKLLEKQKNGEKLNGKEHKMLKRYSKNIGRR